MKQITFNEPPPTPIIPTTFSIETLEPAEIARQLTLIEYEMFKAIAPKVPKRLNYIYICRNF
jgi:hypothetical protein